MVANENLVHIKLEYAEALQSKKDILASQVNLLKILKKVKTYKIYRNQEFELKTDLYKKMKELETNLSILKKALPKLKVPKVVVKEGRIEKQARKMETHDLSIEGQLQDIQKELDELQRRSV